VSAHLAPAPVRVVVADDSSTSRRLLVSLCDQDPGITVVGEASDGMQAVELTERLRPALVLMDVHMPLLDGLEATKKIMRDTPTPIIMITAGTAPSDIEAGLSAVRCGALTLLQKPVGPGLSGHVQSAERLTSMVKALAEVKVVRRRVGTTRPPAEPRGAEVMPVVAIAASTGGPPALCDLLQHLPSNLGAPVVVVQHIVTGFLPGLVEWLRAEVPFHVRQAESGQILQPGHVYLAPDDRHLEVGVGHVARLTSAAPVAGFRPSASVLFSSLARSVGPATTAVVLTGMGQDGLEGARAVRAAGGRVLAQDEQTSAVWGMPRMVAEAGLADCVGTVQQIATAITDYVRS